QIIIEKRDINVIYYLREVNNKLLGFKYNNDMYYYLKNGMEDIIGILDDELNLIVNYEYDSWGKVVSVKDNNGIVITDQTHIGHINPFRYRSYYYDTETGLYYLNSRYYNPEWGRFINADGIIGANEDIFGYNLYLYCSNNPTTFTDTSGEWKLPSLKSIGKAITSAAKTVANSLKNIGEQLVNVVSSAVNVAVEKAVEIIDNTINYSSKKNNISQENINKLPTTGKPNSTAQKPNGDLRNYGPDGNAVTDTDYSHPNHHPQIPNPHAHDWTWNEKGVPSRGPAYDPNINKILIKTTTTIGVGYLIYRGVRMLPSLVPGFWWTIPINAVTP
ncbi:MAG: hypothetical protein PHE54_03095, partial [Bacilli bacterium]|nr:hypothetical protein [Bacilli bacterium]